MADGGGDDDANVAFASAESNDHRAAPSLTIVLER